MKEHNPELYKRMCEPFDNLEEANEALHKFFDGVAKLREECGLPDVLVNVEVVCGEDDRRSSASMYLGDAMHKYVMIARLYGSSRAEYEDIMGDAIQQGRSYYNHTRGR